MSSQQYSNNLSGSQPGSGPVSRPRTSGMVMRSSTNGDGKGNNQNGHQQYGMNNMAGAQYQRNMMQGAKKVGQQSHGGLQVTGSSRVTGTASGTRRGPGNSSMPGGHPQSQVFYQLNNNFIVVNGGNDASLQQQAAAAMAAAQNFQNIHSGVGGVANGQKTAYGFVGGISGHGLNTQGAQANASQVNSGAGSANKNRNLSYKRPGGAHQMITNVQMKNSSQGQSAGYGHPLDNNNMASTDLNKRVLSAQRAHSLNQTKTAGSVVTQGDNNSLQHTTQQFSMQQRRRQQSSNQNTHGKVVVMQNNNFTGGQAINNYTNNGQVINRASGTAGSSQEVMYVTSQSAPGQRAMINSVKNGPVTAVGAQPNYRGSSTGGAGTANTTMHVQESSTGNPTALSTDEGFMRGARIAEKIQEYYHQNNNSNSQNFKNVAQHQAGYAHGAGNMIKQYATGTTKGGKQVRQHKSGVALTGGNLRLVNNKVGGPQQVTMNQNWTQGNTNRVTRTSHGTIAGGVRGRTTAGSSHVPSAGYAHSGATSTQKYTAGGDVVIPSNKTDPSLAHQDIIAGAFKGRASSSYGSLQSRTNVVSQGSVVRGHHHQGQVSNLNKSGISATSGILNYSNYNSNGTMMAVPTHLLGSAESSSKHYQDHGNMNTNFLKASTGTNNTITASTYDRLAKGAEFDERTAGNSQSGSKNQQLTSFTNDGRPQTRDVKLRSQANRNNLLAGVAAHPAASAGGQLQSISQASQNQPGGFMKQKSSMSQNQQQANSGFQTGSSQKMQSQNFLQNKLVMGVVGGFNTNSSALSGAEVNLDGRQSLTGGGQPAGANGPIQLTNEARTFQNTINIGSFINEINNAASGQAVVKGKAQMQSESMANLNHQGLLASGGGGDAAKAAGATTFSNTLENCTDQSFERAGKEGNEIQSEERLIKKDNGQYHSAPAMEADDLKGSDAGDGNRDMYIQDASAGVPGDRLHTDQGEAHADEPLIKIQNQQQHDNKAGAVRKNEAVTTSQGGVVPSSDIRAIKLNYIQLNKRATTASNNPGMGRKIPQKANQVVGHEKAASGGAQLAVTGQKSGANAAMAQYQSNQQLHSFEKQQMNYRAQGPGVYQDANLKSNPTLGHQTMQNWNPGAMQNNFQRPGNGPAALQNQHRQLQTRQTRRFINTNNQPDMQINLAQAKTDVAGSTGPASRAAGAIELGRGPDFVQQHILAQQQNQNQAIHMAQTHALAYHVEKYQEGEGDGSQQDQQNQFCTEQSTIENIDNYIIGKRIGQGAYAVVRVGLHKVLNQKIAVKIYEKFKLLEPNRRKSVKREIKIMEKIDHECLAKLYEAFESHKQVFLIMEYVNGGSLHGYLKGKPNRQMAEIEAKYVWQQVVFAIHYLHQRNVTHRDIKLENILLDETRTRVKLIDFGFSTWFPHEKKVKIFCGTPSYMAPEIVSKIEYSGPPADIWALGVLLYALLCGRFPFKGQSDKELYTNICKQELPLPDHISKQGKQLLLRIFNKNPDKRPSTKDILRDPWLQFSARDQEMMSPKSLAFISYLKKVSGINFGALSQSGPQSANNKAAMSKTAAGGFRQANGARLADVEPVSAAAFVIQSKDKRHQLHASDVKTFILDDNARRALVVNQKRQNQSIASELTGSVNTYNQTTSQHAGLNSQKDGARLNLNNTMPVGGIVQESLQAVRQSSVERRPGADGMQFGAISPEPGVKTGEGAPSGAVSGAGEPQKKAGAKINMEAYQAYYNTNESNNAGGGGAGAEAPTAAGQAGTQANNAEQPKED